jgi:hypothetical protein
MNNISTEVPGFLDQCAITFDIDRIKQDLLDFSTHFNFHVDTIVRNITDPKKIGQVSINLTHPEFTPKVIEVLNNIGGNQDLNRSKYIGPLSFGDRPAIELHGIEPSSYNVIGEFFNDKYLGDVIRQVQNYHANMNPGMEPVTRVNCAYLDPAAGFTLHKDTHTHMKYHLPIYTNPFAYIMTHNVTSGTIDGDTTFSHLPADGKLWVLNTNEFHNAINLSPIRHDYRMHIIFSVYDSNGSFYDSIVKK